jgi:hypothetical protein
LISKTLVRDELKKRERLHHNDGRAKRKGLNLQQGKISLRLCEKTVRALEAK